MHCISGQIVVGENYGSISDNTTRNTKATRSGASQAIDDYTTTPPVSSAYDSSV